MSMPTSSKTLSAAQVAARLGVRVETVYAYVSREILSRSVASDGRSSRFDSAEVEALARRGRPRKGMKRVGTVDVSLASSLTQVSPEGRLAYRGHEIASLAASCQYEQVAELLWTGEIPPRRRWSGGPDAAGLRASKSLPKKSPPVERLAVVAAAMACAQEDRGELREADVIRQARRMIQTFVAALPLCGRPGPGGRSGVGRDAGVPARGKEGDASGGRLAARLWPRLSPRPANRSRLRALDTALIVLADHELATSTLAARVAASTRADAFLAVVAGLAAVSGALHGRAAAGAYDLLAAAEAESSGAAAVAAVLSGGGARSGGAGAASLPGFGHPVYEESDPRTEILLARVLETATPAAAATILEVREAADAETDAAANIDFALGALAYAEGMAPAATEAVFAIARTAGWIAHVLEEYGEAPLRFRARAIYDGS
ncbi:MAG: citrate/2-methylcitrate synthase [Myxococcota bacterium]